MASADFGKIDLLVLPRNLDQLKEQGLLYLPRPYVVPGGRFNEMYGWDSYFIQVDYCAMANCNSPRTWRITFFMKYSITAKS